MFHGKLTMGQEQVQEGLVDMWNRFCGDVLKLVHCLMCFKEAGSCLLQFVHSLVLLYCATSQKCRTYLDVGRLLA